MESKVLLKEFMRYLTLNVIGMIGLSGYILADTFFVSMGLGAGGLAALNLAIPIYSFIHGSGLMLGIGGAIRYSIFKSQNEHERANHAFTSIICLTIAVAMVFTFMGLFLSESIIP